MKVEASAPSNIALIKYMGKTATGNRPANASLSYTLKHLRSFVVIEASDKNADEWQPLAGFPALQLSETGRTKFLNHFLWLKNHWNIEGRHTVFSANNFPADCGLASSASSFAALTLATWELAGRPEISREELSGLSRRGSGSSCRSFFSPWAIWRNENAEALPLDLQLEHAVIVVAGERKSVSSSEAHARVATSLLYATRSERAETRLQELVTSLKSCDWREAFEITWTEFFDMHALFETSRPPFGYFTAESQRVLTVLRQRWEDEGDGPLVTMDAGPNIHLLWRPDQRAQAERWLAELHTMKTIKSW